MTARSSSSSSPSWCATTVAQHCRFTAPRRELRYNGRRRVLVTAGGVAAVDVQPYPPPSPPQFPREPPHVLAPIVAVRVLAGGAHGGLGARGSSARWPSVGARRTGCRARAVSSAALRASAASEQAQVSALATTVDAQQKTLTDLGSQLGATQTQLATTQSKLGTTQSQLQTAQSSPGHRRAAVELDDEAAERHHQTVAA